MFCIFLEPWFVPPKLKDQLRLKNEKVTFSNYSVAENI